MTFEKVIKDFATRGLRVKEVQRYLDAGGEINHRDAKMDWTLLHFAAEEGNLEVIRLLATRGADLNLRDRSGWTALHVAVDRDLDTSGRGGRRASNLPTAQTLIETGADESARAEDGATPRDLAGAYGQVTSYDSLLRDGGRP